MRLSEAVLILHSTDGTIQLISPTIQQFGGMESPVLRRLRNVVTGFELQQVFAQPIDRYGEDSALVGLTFEGVRTDGFDEEVALERLTSELERHLQDIQAMVERENRSTHEERLRVVETQLQDAVQARAILEAELSKLAHSARGNESTASMVNQIQQRLGERQLTLVEMQARRDALMKIRDELAERREKLAHAQGESRDADDEVAQQLKALVSIRERQAHMLETMAEQGVGPNTAREEAQARLADARLQLARYRADQARSPDAAAQADQRLAELSSQIDQAELEIESSAMIVKALREELVVLDERLADSQQAASRQPPVAAELAHLDATISELRQQIAHSTQLAQRPSPPVRIRRLAAPPPN
jgi:hypothetical protein